MQVFARKTGKMLLMALALVALMFVVSACGRNGDDPDPSPSPAPLIDPAPGPVDPVDPVAPVDPGLPEVLPHEGAPRTIRISAWYIHQLHGAAPRPDYDRDGSSDPEIAWMQYNNMRAVEERFNVRIEHVETVDYSDHLAFFMDGQIAGDPIGEIVLLSGSQLLSAIQANQLTDLAQVNFRGSDLHGSRTSIIATAEQDGSIWQVNTNTGGPVWASYGLGVNMDIVNRLGLPDPIALYEAGNWNWDNFLSMMRTAQGQGYYGLGGVPNDIGRMLVASNDAQMVTPDLNFGYDQPATMAALNLFSTIMEERLWKQPPDGADDWYGTMGTWNEQMFGFRDGDALFFSMYLWVPNYIVEGGEPFEFHVLPFPAGPNNTTGASWGGGFEQAVVIPAGVENPELVLAVMEALMAWHGGDTFLVTEALLGQAASRLQTMEDNARWVYLTGSRRLADPSFDVSGFHVFNDFAFDILTGTRTIAESVEYRRGPLQELLDNMFR